jgi:predicted PurR-regulated permease PerM
MEPASPKKTMPEMEFAQNEPKLANRKAQESTLFLLALAALALYFCYLISRPFLTPLFLALMVAIVFHPIHLWIERRIPRRNLAALTSTILVVVTVIVPTVLVGALVAREAHAAYAILSEKSAEQGGWSPLAMQFLERVSQSLGRYVALPTVDLRATLIRSLQEISQTLLSWGTHFLRNIVSFVVGAIIALVTIFLLFQQGESLKVRVAAFLPLRADQFERLFTGISDSILANVYGCLAVAASQGIFMSLGFWLVGLPSPILWGLLTAFCSLIPIVGSLLVWGPATLFLFVSGHWGKGLILLAWSAGLVSQIDNFVRPYVVSQRANMHPLLMFFALLGGVQAFGPLGLFIGPVVVSVTLVALKMLREENLDVPAA